METVRVLPKKATEDKFNELHNLVTADLKAACDWLKTNDITGVAYDGSPLDKLNKILPTVDPELVRRRMYGSKAV
jgi:hypothetical protein